MVDSDLDEMTIKSSKIVHNSLVSDISNDRFSLTTLMQ